MKYLLQLISSLPTAEKSARLTIDLVSLGKHHHLIPLFSSPLLTLYVAFAEVLVLKLMGMKTSLGFVYRTRVHESIFLARAKNSGLLSAAPPYWLFRDI